MIMRNANMLVPMGIKFSALPPKLLVACKQSNYRTPGSQFISSKLPQNAVCRTHLIVLLSCHFWTPTTQPLNFLSDVCELTVSVSP